MTYGKRFERQTKCGQMLIDLLFLRPDREGYYHTSWGRKTTAGLWLTVQEKLKDIKKTK